MDRLIGILGGYVVCGLIVVMMPSDQVGNLVLPIITGIMGIVTGAAMAKEGK